MRHGAVLMRDLVRAARSSRTFWLRLGVTALVLAYSLVSFYGVEQVDVGSLGNIGHDRFVVFTLLLQSMVAVLAPVLVTTALQEERDEHTLELLAMTGLPSLAILFGKYGSRMILLIGVVLGSLPALAVGLSLGGVGTGEMVGATVATAWIGVILACIAGFYAVHARSILGPLTATALWAVASSFFFGLPWALVTRGGVAAGGWAIPFYPNGWSMASLWLIPMWAPLLLAVVGMTILGFRLRLYVDRSGEEPREDASELRWHERAVRVVSALTVGLIVLFPGAWAVAFALLDLVPKPDDEWITLGLAAASWLALGAGTLLYLQVTGRYLEQADRWMAALATLGRGLVPKGQRWPIGSFVLRDPVVTRELVTRPYGATTVGLIALAIAWVVMAAFVWFLALLVDGPKAIGAASVFTGALGILLVYAVTVVLSTSSFAEERRARTLPLLFTTPYGPGRVVLGKAFAVLARVLPALWIADLMTLAGSYQWTDLPDAYAPLSFAVTVAATTAATTAALTWAMLVAARARPAGIAWPVVLATPFLGMIVAAIFAAFDADLVVFVLFPWAPLLDDDQIVPQAAAAVAYAAFTLVGLTVLSLRLRTWILAET